MNIMFGNLPKRYTKQLNYEIFILTQLNFRIAQLKTNNLIL